MPQLSDDQRPLYEVKANLFRGLSHPIRIRVLEILSATDTATVTDLMEETHLEASHMSQHLAVLRRNNLVVAERRGSQVFYSLAYPDVADLLTVARALLVKILERNQQDLVGSAALPAIGPLRPPTPA